MVYVATSVNFNLVRWIQLLLDRAQLSFLKGVYWCLKQKAGWKSLTRGGWLWRGDRDAGELPLPGVQHFWDCQGDAGHSTPVLPPPVPHLCRARYSQTPWNKLCAKINFTAYPWCIKTKTLHDNCLSNNSQDPHRISVACQASGEEAAFSVFKCPWSVLYADAHMDIICGKDWGSEVDSCRVLSVRRLTVPVLCLLWGNQTSVFILVGSVFFVSPAFAGIHRLSCLVCWWCVGVVFLKNQFFEK